MIDFQYYLKVDISEKKILDILDRLDENFGNINGLEYLDPIKLEDLTWMGYNIGFIKIVPKCRSRINQYHCNQEILEKFKNKLKDKIRFKQTSLLQQGVKINNQYFINLTDSEKILLTMKYLYCINNQNSSINYYASFSNKITLKSKDFIVLYEKIINYIDEISEMQIKVINQIDATDNLLDLFSFNLDSIKLDNNITI